MMPMMFPCYMISREGAYISLRLDMLVLLDIGDMYGKVYFFGYGATEKKSI